MTKTPTTLPIKPVQMPVETESGHCRRLIEWDGIILLRSRAHKKNHSSPQFEQWLKDTIARECGNEVVCPQHGWIAADACLQGVSMRTDEEAPQRVRHLWHCHLPLASNTQFVERGVKEAKIVASTRRKEEQRSAHAIIGSFSVHCDEVEAVPGTVERIESLIWNVQVSVGRKKALMRVPGDQCKVAWNKARQHLHGNHFKCERVEGLATAAMESMEQNKSSNVRQQVSGVPVTVAQAGLIQHKQLHKDCHVPLPKEELEF